MLRCGSYTSSSIKVLVGDLCSDEVEVNRGVRQGCPLSPIIFDVFINDILARVSGVRVPGLDEGGGRKEYHIPGFMLADDVAVLAPTGARLRSALDEVDKWARTWGMKPNAKKCGVMVLLDGNRHARAKGESWMLGGDHVPVVDAYKYLGIMLSAELDLKVAIDHRAAQAQKALQMNRSLLQDRSIPLMVRVLALKTLIYPSLVHGGELTGLRDQTLYRPLQRLLKQGLSWVMQGGGKATLAGGAVMREFGLAPIVAQLAAAKARALSKYPTLHTWAAKLTSSAPLTQKRTWVTGGRTEIGKLFRGKITYPPEDPRVRSKLVRKLRWKAWERQETALGTRHYLLAGYDQTRSYIKRSVDHPDLAKGCSYLARLRTGCYWTGFRAAGAGLIPDEWRGKCPSCGLETRDTIPHLLVSCPKYAPERDECLGELLDRLQAWAGEHCGTGALFDDEIAILLLGGGVRGKCPSRRAWTGRGTHIAGDPGFVRVARYLQTVLPYGTCASHREPTPRTG